MPGGILGDVQHHDPTGGDDPAGANGHDGASTDTTTASDTTPEQASDELVVDFAGEVHHVAPGEVFTIGRTGSLEIDDNPYLHRVFLEIRHTDGLWWVANVGTHLAAHMADVRGLVRTTLAPGARQPLVFETTLVTFMAGSTSYEIELELERAAYQVAQRTPHPSADATIGPTEFTESQLLAILALAEPVLRREGTGVGHVPTAVEAASRLGWTQTRFNRKLDNVCQKLEAVGVSGLRGGPGSQASNRRATLVDYAVSTLLVTVDDLPKLREESARNRA